MNARLSHKTQLLVVAATASIATAGLLSCFYEYSRRRRRRQLDEEVRKSVSSHDALPLDRNLQLDDFRRTKDAIGQIIGDTGGYDEELIKEQLARNYALFGEDGMKRIRNSSVVVVGCGGVGSWAAVMLVRSCVKYRAFLQKGFYLITEGFQKFVLLTLTTSHCRL